MDLFKQFIAICLPTNFPEITSLLYIINNKCNDTINDLDVHVFRGNDHIFEEMEGLRFKVGPKSFYQTNSEQAYNLYKVARDFAGLTGDELVYDLYTGTGTIANFVSRQARKVIGIEYVPEAIEDAKVECRDQWNREHPVLCRRHEGYPDTGFHQSVRASGCNHHRPSPGGNASGCGRRNLICRTQTDRIC